jgi:hypothetical protein
LAEEGEAVMAGEHVFCVEGRAYLAMSDEEVKASVAGLKEMDLYHLPFSEGQIILRFLISEDHYLEARGLGEADEFTFDHILISRKGEGRRTFKIEMDVGKPTYKDLTPYFEEMPKVIDGNRVIYRFRDRGAPHILYANKDACRDFLILLLASRGVEKKTKDVSKLRRLGIGKRDQSAAYITTIRLSSNLQRGNAEEAKPGLPVRPHLRRGHIRHQHYGPNNSQIKKIWIEPVFVNADDDFISSRTAYRILH